MRLIVSTNHRGVHHDDTSGWLYVINLENGEILRKTAGIEPPFRQLDTNPRGGMRGMRGISILNGELAVANYSAVFFFDLHWNLTRAFSHPAVSAIHEILYGEDGLWVTSTANDLLVKYALSGILSEYYLVRDQVDLMRTMHGTTKRNLRTLDILNPDTDFRQRSYFNSDKYDRTHLNSLALTQDGHLLLSLGLIVSPRYSLLMYIKTMMLKIGLWNIFLKVNRTLRRILGFKKQLHSDLVIPPAMERSAIVKFDRIKTWDIILQFVTAHNPSHTIRTLRDGTCVYLDTSTGSLVHFDISGFIHSKTVIGDSFLRGLLELPNGQLVVGSGNSLLFFDLSEMKVIHSIKFSEKPHETVFDVQLLPDEFELPPESLEFITGRILGYEGERILWSRI
jgi:hypothetical protein